MISFLLLSLGGVGIIALQIWAVSAAPRRVLRKSGDNDTLARAAASRFRRRMLVSFIFTAGFVGVCLVYGRVWGRRADEAERHLRELEEAGRASRADRPPDGAR